jgi:glycosyltransferase involved in cell wall biosynthesis
MTDPAPIPTLSVVVIARNEEETIGRCLESILEATKDLNAEVLFVDSASTDRTVEQASRYPIRIAQFNPGGTCTPSAGRWLGTLLTRGEYIFFVDGDMIVINGWIAKALEELRIPERAGVAGRLFWVNPGEAPTMNRKDVLPLGIVRALGGAAVYSRSSLDAAGGGFNPFARGEEERELGYRLAFCGYTAVRIDQPMAYHLDKPRSVTEIIEKAVYFTGVGQIMRRHPFRRICWDLVREYAEVFAFGGLCLACVAATLFLAAMGFFGLIFVCTLAILLILLSLGLWKGYRRLTLYLRARILANYYFVRGLLKGLPPADAFPLNFTWIKKGP